MDSFMFASIYRLSTSWITTIGSKASTLSPIFASIFVTLPAAGARIIVSSKSAVAAAYTPCAETKFA